ncbi:YqzH family protein [Ectobacillus panaciterrae]|uniref:YqzH family protein n=1 Tax=Ectobacillus panaciterrae TaxID=363872 RepID=UPI000421A837|nr:YqzH family protein [Ectobacillus panaciterrae]
MDEKFLRKLIRNCFYQYQYSKDSIPLSENEYAELAEKVRQAHQDNEADLRDLVEDAVYEYITK